MTDIQITGQRRDGLEHFKNLDVAVYSKKLFSMFSGAEETVRIKFANRLVGVVIDRFGKDVTVVPSINTHLVVQIDVAVSPQFISWIAGFGSEAKILSPDSLWRCTTNECKKISGGAFAPPLVNSYKSMVMTP